MPESYSSVPCRVVCKFLALVAAGVVIGILWAVDPMECGWLPKCVFHSLTGYQCPGCGVTRAAHALLNGRFVEAFSYNYFFIISIPYLLAAATAVYLPQFMPAIVRRFVVGPVAAWGYFALFMVWWVVRNILSI